MSDSIIQIVEAEFSYKTGGPLLRVTRLCVKEADFIVIIGPNGSGKTTLCKLLVGVLTPNRSQCFELPVPPPVLVWQEQELFPLTVERNLTIVSRDATKATELLQNFHLLDKRGSFPEELSGGEKEKLAIARALAGGNRKAIIFDEPTQSIDATFVDDVAAAILRTRDTKVAAIVVTHDDRLVSGLSRANPLIYVIQPQLKEGKRLTRSELLGPYNLKDLYEKPPTLYAAEFARYENIYKVADRRKPLDARNLHPIPDAFDPNMAFIVVPEAALRIDNNYKPGSVIVSLSSIEFRSGGHPVARYRYDPGGGMAPVEFLVGAEGFTPAPKTYLSLDPSKCIEIKA